MDYFEISRLMEEAKNECLKPVDDSCLLKDFMEKSFNQGVTLMFNMALLKVAQAETEARKEGGKNE